MEEGDLNRKYELIVFGGSAGSLEVLLNTLQGLTTDRFPIIIVIHRKSAPYSDLAGLFSSRASLTVKEAEEKEIIVPGVAYLAPADYHLLIEKDHTFSLDDSEKVNFSRPSIDVTFECAADVYGSKAIGILLSGANADGIEGLKAIKRAGGLCVVQDPSTAKVSFMPQLALNEMEIGTILSAEDIASFINRLRI